MPGGRSVVERTSGSRTGLSSAEAARRLVRDGPNVVPEQQGVPAWLALARQFTHLLALLLIAAAGMALLAGMPALTVAIVAVVVLNAGFAFWQEWRADRSAERLRALLPTGVRVRRDQAVTVVPAREIVRGDLVVLGSGDRVAADMRVLTASALELDESMVTGESAAVTHGPGDPLMSGTFVVQGSAEAEVTEVGGATTLAKISDLAGSAVRPPSPLTVQLSRVVKVVAGFALGTGVLLGAVGLLLGLEATEAFLFGVGVTVALVPEGLLPTVTLSLAHGAQLMARRSGLVRRLDAVETLGATTYVCTDKTGTLTQNRMAVVEVWQQPTGTTRIMGEGYAPTAAILPAEHGPAVHALARGATACVDGRVRDQAGRFVADGDPMEAAIHCLLVRSGVDDVPRVERTLPFSADRMMSSALAEGTLHALGAPEQVLHRCIEVGDAARAALHRMTGEGLRVLAVAERRLRPDEEPAAAERDLVLVGLLGLEDPPRPDVGVALAACRTADIRVAMLTGDHPRTAEAIAREVGLLQEGGCILDGTALPDQDAELGALLDNPHGAVVARVMPADKLRIARVLRERGHVVAMTGDGVNDAPALKEADVGVAMGASGSDVAREAADLVLLDDHFGTIVAAIEQGRATFANVRRFLTYHLTDNVAELAPFAAWALTGGSYPLAISVLQVLALDIGTDLLPALALGTEPPTERVMKGRMRTSSLVDRPLLVRAFGVLGPVEAASALVTFSVVLLAGGWHWGGTPPSALLASASGAAFAAIALAQMANAFACRSDSVAAWRMPLLGNPAVLWAVLAELVLLVVFVGYPPMTRLLGGTWPPTTGWIFAVGGGLTLVLADALHKRVRRSGAAGTVDR